MRLTNESIEIRKLSASDIPALVALAGDRAIADTMISVPHPFTAVDAAGWVDRYGENAPAGPHDYFAICLPPNRPLVGVGALRDIDREHEQCELSFWIGTPYWGRGLATSAGELLVARAFAELKLNRIVAFHMLRNPASGKVLERLGFTLEGVLRQRVRKWGVYEDVAALALLRRDYAARRSLCQPD